MEGLASRIKEVIDSEGLTNSEFAKKIEINPAIISHILSGRNKPSLQVIEKIKTSFTNVNLDYLLTGSGTMYTDVTNVKEPLPVENAMTSSAFPMEGIREVSVPGDVPIPTPSESGPVEDETTLPHPPEETPKAPKRKETSKKVVKVILLYDDKSFEMFDA